MLQTSDGETEILLGNKQLLGIFFVVVILLGVAFAGGYKVGQGSKKATIAAVTSDSPTSTGPGETHTVDPGTATSAAPPSAEPSPTPAVKAVAPTHTPEENSRPLGSRAKAAKASSSPTVDPEAAGPAPITTAHSAFTPQPGETFLQVAAVGRDEAEGISDVLRKKGFRAHAVPKPGSTKLYRVIIGPVRDAGDLNTTRAALRNTGFREIIAQKY